MNIYDALAADHRTVVALLQRAEGATPSERVALVQQAMNELTAHATAEEELLYAAIEGADDAHDLVVEAREEHLSVARLLGDLALPTLSDELRLAKARVLLEQLEHHIEEEEDELFDKAETLIDGEAAVALAGEFGRRTLGKEFLARKEQLMALPLDARIADAVKTLLAPAHRGGKDAVGVSKAASATPAALR